MTSTCLNCGKSFDSHPSDNALCCSRDCWNTYQAKQPPKSKDASRKRAQRALSLTGAKCSKCGSTIFVDRHHPDYAKPLDVMILCRKCHRQQDIAEGRQRVIQPRPCEVCGEMVKQKKRKASAICQKVECRRELGRRNAQKRWASK